MKRYKRFSECDHPPEKVFPHIYVGRDHKGRDRHTFAGNYCDDCNQPVSMGDMLNVARRKLYDLP